MDYPLKREERAIFELRALYRKYGYSQFKMSKFEEYDLYARNKDFLVSDGVITFTDTDGRLMALKPDVTLSIIKNSRFDPGCVKKVYYNENVYRISGSEHCFKEIMQTGLECIGDVDLYDLGEVISLAAKSLELIDARYVLDLSHVGVVAALVDALGLGDEDRAEALRCVSEKNADGIRKLCRDVDPAGVLALIDAHGAPDRAIGALRPYCREGKALKALTELDALCALLTQSGCDGRIQVDFSIVNDMNYYNGIVFQGYIDGLPSGVLSGGQYDELMARMSRSGRAVGFAIYLDLLERLGGGQPGQYDVDTLLLYDDTADPLALTKAIQELTEAGHSVSAQRAMPDKLRCRQVLVFTEGGITAHD